jgi:adenylate cyclase
VCTTNMVRRARRYGFGTGSPNAVNDLGATQLKNIAEPVHVYSLEVGKPAKAKPKAVATDRRRLLMPVIGGIAAVIVIIAALAWWQFLARQKPGASAHAPPRLSMVVLPFANLSGDSSQDYLADSITENLTTELSHIRHSFVIARNTAFTFKGKSINAKEIGRELDVRYVMEGSVQRDGHRVRVNAQLIDAESGAHIWAERFENDLADLFKLQDEVVARLARSLQMELVNAEVLRTLHDRSQNPDSIDLTLRGFALINQGITKAFYAPARDAFDQALKLDPNNADALAGAAFLDMRDYLLSWSGQPDVDFHARAMQRANEAILASTNQPYAHLTKTYLLMFRANPGDVARANEMIAEAEAALRADPSLATAYLPMSVGKELIGRYEEALSDMDRAIRISPHDPYVGLWHEQKGRALLGLGRHDEAIQEGVKAIDEGYRTIIGYTALAAFTPLQRRCLRRRAPSRRQ